MHEVVFAGPPLKGTRAEALMRAPALLFGVLLT